MKDGALWVVSVDQRGPRTAHRSQRRRTPTGAERSGAARCVPPYQNCTLFRRTSLLVAHATCGAASYTGCSNCERQRQQDGEKGSASRRARVSWLMAEGPSFPNTELAERDEYYQEWDDELIVGESVWDGGLTVRGRGRTWRNRVRASTWWLVGRCHLCVVIPNTMIPKAKMSLH